MLRGASIDALRRRRSRHLASSVGPVPQTYGAEVGYSYEGQRLAIRFRFFGVEGLELWGVRSVFGVLAIGCTKGPWATPQPSGYGD